VKILLISPKGPLYRSKGGIFKKSLRYQPLTLTALAALVPPELNAEVELIDEGIADVPDGARADLVGLTVITGTAPRSYALAARLRARGIPVVLGGPHVTLNPEEAAANADAVCIGYAEESWPRLLRDFARGALAKTYRQEPGLKLEARAFPRRELLDGRRFLTQAVFEATRSCAHDCEFCVAPAAWGREQLQNPVEWVVEDIRRVGAKRLIFIDLNLVSDVAYAERLFTALIPLNVQWFGLSTVLIAHRPALMELMARSGCRGLLLGLETVTGGSLGDAGKRFNASVDYKKLIGGLHALGVCVQGCFVFGFDHDGPDVFDATVQFAIDAGVDLPRFSVQTPFPGTPLFRRLEAEGRILTRDWELYDGQHVVFQPRRMTPLELAAGHERAWKAVYGWPSIARRLWNARNFQPLALSANLGYRFYARNLSRFYNCDWPTAALFPERPRGAAAPPALAPASAAASPSGNRTVCG
jgi:radical SAM superfamily enzyme YgiQ (UPF0313 family)